MTKPSFRSLNRDEIHALLARNHVGRIAYSRDDVIDIEPLHYVYSDGWIYGRTSPGKKLEMVGGWWPVAFEVDEITDLFDWRSAVIHGGFYTLSNEGAPWELREYEKAVQILRRLIPEAFTEHDPSPHRNVVFRIAIQEVSGREATPSS